MVHPTGESESDVVRLDFDRRLMLQFLWVRGHVRRGIVGIPRTRRCTRLDRDGGRDTR
jgi:hypothetical protein